MKHLHPRGDSPLPTRGCAPSRHAAGLNRRSCQQAPDLRAWKAGSLLFIYLWRLQSGRPVCRAALHFPWCNCQHREPAWATAWRPMRGGQGKPAQYSHPGYITALGHCLDKEFSASPHSEIFPKFHLAES